MSNGVIVGEGGGHRCWWCGDDALYVRYHDQEWGVPVDDDRRLFEKICLEGFQAGLSWITVLRKRESFRDAYSQFDFDKVARFGPAKIEALANDAALIRHRGKIGSTINNAQRVPELIDQFGSLAAFLWRFEPHGSAPRCREEVRSTCPESVALSKELKRRGWSFVGPTTCYSLMQAMGMVNDHLPGCDRWQEIDRRREAFRRPGES